MAMTTMTNTNTVTFNLVSFREARPGSNITQKPKIERIVILLFNKLKAFIAKPKKSLFMMAMAAMAVAALPAAVGAAPIDFSTSGSLEVDIADTVASGWNFFNMFGTWTTLVIGLILVPTLGGFIFWVLRKLPKFSGGKKA